jgi:FkbM family methyltransferase
MKSLANLFNFFHHNNRVEDQIIQCPNSFAGSEYGGWYYHPNILDENSIIFSFGIGDDASFDKELIKIFGCKVYAFDPTPQSIKWVESQSWPKNFEFYKFGLSNKDTKTDFFPPDNPNHISHTIVRNTNKIVLEPITVQMHKLSTITDLLNQKKISILKMDIEGAEYDAIDDILSTKGVFIEQILVEFHHFLPGFSKNQTNRTIHKLKKSGYQLIKIAPSGNEFSFVHTDFL